MKIFPTRKVDLIVLGLLVCSLMSAQNDVVLTDSMKQVSVSLDDTHKLGYKQFIIPTTIVGFSTLCVNNGWLKEKRECLQGVLSPKGTHHTRVDDFTQYVPMAAVYGFNLCGIKGQHKCIDRTLILGLSWITVGVVVNSMKYTIKEKRPDSNARNSFPSGHTATAFMGAEFMYQEYKNVSPWLAYSGYVVAGITGYLRIYNDRHYLNDVLAGACIGIMSTKFAYWLYPKIFNKSNCTRELSIVGVPYFSSNERGINVCLSF